MKGRIIETWEKDRLRVGLSIPVVGKRLPELDPDVVFGFMESLPLHSRWLANLPHELREKASRVRESSIDVRERHHSKRFTSRIVIGRDLFGAGAWSSTSLSSEARQEGPERARRTRSWEYRINLIFVTDEAGDIVDGWRGIWMNIESSDLHGGLPAEWIDEVWDLMHGGAVALGALAGYARHVPYDYIGPSEDRYRKNHDLPPVDPNDFIRMSSG